MSSPRRVGLPASIRMRHDRHFVDRLSHPSGSPVGQSIPLEDLLANPDQPRRDLGDLDDLIASIREKGILEPLLVRPFQGRYQIIAGERRYRAALEAGLDEVPCIIREASDAEVMELALIENLQRKDLGAFEEADGLGALRDTFGYTHEEMAERLGKSRSSITETLALAGASAELRELCRRADITSKSLLLQVVRLPNIDKARALVEQLGRGTPTRDAARRIARAARSGKGRGRPKNYVFKFQPKERSFNLALQFRKGEASKDEIIAVLRQVLAELEG